MTKKKTVTPDTPYVRELQRKAQALDAIHAELDGKEWDADLMSVVASHLIGAGYKIREPSEVEPCEECFQLVPCDVETSGYGHAKTCSHYHAE